MNDQSTGLFDVLDTNERVLNRVLESRSLSLSAEEVGRVEFMGNGTARITGLPGVQSEELVRFPGDRLGMAFNLDPDEVGVVLLDRSQNIAAGAEVRRSNRVLDVPVGDALIGRVVDGVGRPLDEKGPVRALHRLPVERPAPAIMDRAPVQVPLETGLKVVDALIPVGRGQRQLILGDRQTGKTAIALDTILNQRDKGVICIYCAIGQRASSVARVVDTLTSEGGLEYCSFVVTTEDDPPGLQYVAPYAAMSMSEHFTQHGRDVLIVFDDLTRHARAYRELSLLLRRPPGREAYPGDIFYIHSRLLERSTHLRQELGGGSITAFPIVETEAQNMAAYIPTNLISITDGQIYLSPELFDKGVLPAVDVGKSVSRVGGKTQLAAFRGVAGDLRLSYSQFEELETFARFGTRLDEDTRKQLDRGRCVREFLKQSEYSPLKVSEQIAILVAVNNGAFDEVPLDRIPETEADFRKVISTQLPELEETVRSGSPLPDEEQTKISRIASEIADRQKPARSQEH